MFEFMVGCAVGAAAMYFWPKIRAKVIAWYGAWAAKI